MATGAEAELCMDARTFFERQPEIGRAELVDGMVQPMSPTRPTHGAVEALLCHALVEYLRERGHGRVLAGDVGYELAEDHVRAPDLAIHLERPPAVPRWETVPPDIAVEIVSPTDGWTYLERKVADYLAAGVREVWVVDPARRTVSVRASDGSPRTFGADDALQSEVLTGFSVQVESLFD